MEEIPKPFIIEPGKMEEENFDFNLTLIGKAINYFPYFFYLFLN